MVRERLKAIVIGCEPVCVFKGGYYGECLFLGRGPAYFTAGESAGVNGEWFMGLLYMQQRKVIPANLSYDSGPVRVTRVRVYTQTLRFTAMGLARVESACL